MAESILQQSKKAQGLGGLGKKAKTIILVLVLLSGAYAGYNYLTQSRAASSRMTSQQKTATVTKGDIQLAVETDGTVTAEDGVELSFSTTGETVEKIYVQEGDTVKQGDKIASISTDSMQYELQNTQDSYKSALLALSEGKAGATEKEIKNANYQVEQAEQGLAQAKTSAQTAQIDAAEKVKNAEDAITTAQNNLKLNTNGNSKISDDAYADLYTDVEGLALTFKNELYSADKILGIDDSSLNDDFEGVLGVLNTSSLSAAKTSYAKAKSARNRLDTLLASTSKTDHAGMDALSDQAEVTAAAMKELYVDLQDLLDNTITTSTLSQSELDSKKSSVSATRSSISGNITTLGKDRDAIDNADDSVEDLQTAYDQAVTNLADVKRQNETDASSAQTAIRNKEIALDQAKMNYAELIAPLSTAELQRLVTAVNQAKNNLKQVEDKIAEATLTSPIDGQVGNINGKEGSLISDNNSESFVTIINKDTLFVKVSVEESDISSISKGQKAYVTFDALDDLEMEGTVTYISMTAGESNSGVVTYEVRVVLSNVGQTAVMEGMTAYVKFVSDEVTDVLTLPVAAVTNVDGVASVKMAGGTYREVVTGFTDGETVEIVEGLNEGDKIVY